MQDSCTSGGGVAQGQRRPRRRARPNALAAIDRSDTSQARSTPANRDVADRGRRWPTPAISCSSAREAIVAAATRRHSDARAPGRSPTSWTAIREPAVAASRTGATAPATYLFGRRGASTRSRFTRRARRRAVRARPAAGSWRPRQHRPAARRPTARPPGCRPTGNGVFRRSAGAGVARRHHRHAAGSRTRRRSTGSTTRLRVHRQRRRTTLCGAEGRPAERP